MDNHLFNTDCSIRYVIKEDTGKLKICKRQKKEHNVVGLHRSYGAAKEHVERLLALSK